jgi:hypothetical protein
MRFLMFMDGLESVVGWALRGAVLIVIVGLPIILLWAPGVAEGWKKTVLRLIGACLAPLVVLLMMGVFIGVGLGAGDTRKVFSFRSGTGSRGALLLHEEGRDWAGSRLTVKGKSCCRTYVAYEYYGQDDDYVDGKSIRWLDDHHLEVRYVIDSSGRQNCQQRVSDIEVICEPQPAPRFPNNQ